MIQAQLRSVRDGNSQPSPSQGTGSSGTGSSMIPGIVACSNCKSKFAEGVNFAAMRESIICFVVSGRCSSERFPCPRCSSPLPHNSRFLRQMRLNHPACFTDPEPPPLPVGSLYAPECPPAATGRAGLLALRRRVSREYKFCGRCGTGLALNFSDPLLLIPFGYRNGIMLGIALQWTHPEGDY